MFKFYNPLDPSKDGMYPLVDGIRYNIRNSEMVKEAVYENLSRVVLDAPQSALSPLRVLEAVLKELNFSLDDLTIADEHELLDAIRVRFFC